MVWIYFAVCVLIIFFAGRRIARYGDIIANETGLGGIWIGVMLLAVATSLPELFLGISAVLWVGVPELTVANLFGANVFNLLNLVLLDVASRNQGPLLASLMPGHERTAWLSIAVVLLVAASIFVSRFFSPGIGWMGWYVPVIIVAYVFAARAIYHHEQKQSASRADDEKIPTECAGVSLRKVYVHFGISAAFIIGAGCWLATIGEEIATVTGWGSSFVGSLFLALTTTLPEITVSLSALRIGARDLAVANMIGSNLFNMAIIPVVDLFYLDGYLLADVSYVNMLTAGIVIMMTVVLIGGLRLRSAKLLGLGWWAIALIALFLVAAYLNFTLGA